MPRIWVEYCTFLIEQKLITQTRRAFDRALRSLPVTQHEKVWKLYIGWVTKVGVPETAMRVYRRYLKVHFILYSSFLFSNFFFALLTIYCYSLSQRQLKIT